MANNDFSSRFGISSQASISSGEAREKAKIWINLGVYKTVDKTDEKGKVVQVEEFISLPYGIALDTMADLPTNSSNEAFRNLSAAKNDLKAQLLEYVRDSIPEGETARITLSAEIRHARGEVVPATPEENPYAVRLNFAAK